MKLEDIRKLSAAVSARAARLAAAQKRAAETGRPAAPAKPAKAAAPGPRPVPPKKVVKLEVVAGKDVERPKRRIKISPQIVAAAKAKGRHHEVDGSVANRRLFEPYKPAPGVLPSDKKLAPLAMDSGIGTTVTWAGGAFLDASYFAGEAFLGYPVLSEMAQRTEYRKACERLSTEMTRKWIELTSTGEDDKSDLIKEIDDFMKEIKFREHAEKAAFVDAALGRSHLYLDTGDTDSPEELKMPIGDGVNRFSEAKVSPQKPLKRIKVVEPTFTYPAAYNASDPLAPDWLKPETWYVMGKEVHRSRLLTFVGREVPDLFKPAYAFGGLSLIQMMKIFVENWTSTRQHVNKVVANFSKNGIKTDLLAQLAPSEGGQASSAGDLMARVDFYNALSDNNGTIVLDKESEEFFQFNTPLGTLDQLQAQSLEQLCLPSGMPVVIFLGLTPHGLNASSEGELRTWEAWVEAYQQHFYGDAIQRIIRFAQLSLRGAVDPSIGYKWVPLRSMDEKQIAEIQKIKADRDGVYLDRGTLDPVEVRQSLAGDPNSGYTTIDVDDVPELPEPEEETGGEDEGAEEEVKVDEEKPS